ncbi:transposase [Methylobacterium goesingense]|uniref:transposase n=1 Tax=Methylobacterium goesingense TaxID=243690 RepID=UPI003571047D
MPKRGPPFLPELHERAAAVDGDGHREKLGVDVGPSAAEAFWTAFLLKLTRRGRGAVSRGLRSSEPRSSPSQPRRWIWATLMRRPAHAFLLSSGTHPTTRTR